MVVAMESCGQTHVTNQVKINIIWSSGPSVEPQGWAACEVDQRVHTPDKDIPLTHARLCSWDTR